MSDDWDNMDWEFGQAMSEGYKKGRKSMLAERDAAIERAEAAEAQVAKLREALERPTPEMKMAGYRVTGNYDIAHDCWAQMARAALEPAGKEPSDG